jgi:hypothetical protein
MRFPNLHASVILALGLAFAGCQQAEIAPSSPAVPGSPSAGPAGSSATLSGMHREIQAVKRQMKDPAEADAPADLGDPAAADHAPSPEATHPLGKTAAQTNVWITVKSFAFAHNRAFKRILTVNPGRTFTAVANAIGSSDPILVAFSRTSGSAASTAYTIQIHAFNDDRDSGNLDAKISWTNTTPYVKEVHVMAFAQTESTRGRTDITITGQGLFPLYFPNTPITSWPVFNNTPTRPIGGCTNLQSSRIQLVYGEGGGHASGILAVNNVTGRGGAILENGTATQTLVLQDLLPGGGTSFLMGFMLNAPGSTPTRFTAIQQNLYSCLVP